MVAKSSLLREHPKDIFSSVVNNSGIIEAKSLVNRGGVIRLEGSDPVENTGQVGWQANLAKVENAEGAVSRAVHLMFQRPRRERHKVKSRFPANWLGCQEQSWPAAQTARKVEGY